MSPAAKTSVHPPSRPDWNNLAVLHKGNLAPRANFYNWGSVKDALSYDVSKARLFSLSGTWHFNHASNPFVSPAGFESLTYDEGASGAGWHEMTVPSMWQLSGYGRGPQYTNVNYPIPLDPPNVPLDDNETGSYRRTFVVPEGWDKYQIRLRFEGVDSAFHVWLNGVEVGYHQGSRNPVEFDVTEHLKPTGENLIAVRVYQYCDGTFMEDQDQWRMSGIFRDLHLLGFSKEAHIQDLFVQTKLDAEYRDATLNVKVEVGGSESSSELKLDLYDSNKETVVASATKSGSGSLDFSMPVKDPKKWTAETPNLYHLVATLNSETFVAYRVGFRQVEIKDRQIKVNGERIVIRGANRHEHHPKFGRSVPYEFMKRDLLIMKQYNINAIRTCHQPSDVRLYDLADELGVSSSRIPSVNRASVLTLSSSQDDITLQLEKPTMPYNERQAITYVTAARWITDNPEWEVAYVDRAIQLVRRDQPHPCVIIWSLGNEAFFGRNIEAMYDWIKQYDDSRPIHYEPDWEAKKMDMYSRMYSSVDETIALSKRIDKPLVLCEYIHAMGNGPGEIKEYVETFFTYPNIQGGWVWEWANHGLLTKDKETGDEYYGYGGDFGETVHDGNFCMDGILFSDHTPTPGLPEYKKALEPVKVVSVDRSSSSSWTAEVVNRYDFITLDHLHAKFEILVNGKSVQSGAIAVPSGVLPAQTAKIDLPLPPPSASESDETVVHISFHHKEATLALPADFEVAFDDIFYRPNTSLALVTARDNSQAEKLALEETPSLLTIRSKTVTWTFSPHEGRIKDLIKGASSFFAVGPKPTFYRALTDNDGPEDGADWRKYRLNLAHVTTRHCSWESGSDESIAVKVEQRFAPPLLNWSIDLSSTYTFDANGTVAIRVKGTPNGEPRPSTLPRIGLTMELPQEWASAVTWYGRGPGESYSDKKLSQRLGIHEVETVDGLWTDYEYPQESGNRTDTRWVRFTHKTSSETITAQFVDLEASSDKASSAKLFDWQASHYHVEDVDAAKHPYQLHRHKTDNVVLRLDAKNHGLGSGACGPKTRAPYALPFEAFEYEVILG